MLLGGSFGVCQDHDVSFSRQTPLDMAEPSATFVVRQKVERKAEVYNEHSFSSDDGTPISVVEVPRIPAERPLQQPYRSVDHAFLDAPQTATLAPSTVSVPQPTYSFDSREWVEHYPTGVRSDWDTFSSDRVSSTIASERSSASVMEGNPKLARNVRIAEPNLPSKPIDLTPNPTYAKHLKYADVCGVVVVQSNFPLTEIKVLLHEIELLQRDLNQYMAVPAPKEKIELCLFKDETSYIRFLKDVLPKAPLDRRALYVKDGGKPGVLLVQRTKDFEIDLRHEMTHAIIHASIANVPIWLDEGLAKYFEPVPEERSAKNPYLKTVRWNAKFGAVPSLARLEKLEDIGEMGSREYRDSWSWVHFLIHHSPQSHRLLAGYLQLLATLPEEPENAKKKDKVVIPQLALYLGDVVKSPKEKYLEHFRTWAVEAKDEDE